MGAALDGLGYFRFKPVMGRQSLPNKQCEGALGSCSDEYYLAVRPGFMLKL